MIGHLGAGKGAAFMPAETFTGNGFWLFAIRTTE
jgi:hypothetical protein